MFQNIIVFINDGRQYYLAKALRGKHLEVAWPDDNVWMNCKAIVLPTPVSKIDEYDSVDKLMDNIIKYKPRIYAGSISDKWRKFFLEEHIEYVDVLEDEKVVEANAQITAEATIGLIIINSLYSIRNEKIIVAGFGRCGKAISGLLLEMGAKVTVLARSCEARKEAKLCGMNSADFSYGPQEAYGSRVIINTVPAPVIGEKIIKEMHKDCLVIDIASKPGGCDYDALKKYGIKYISALGLPGKYEKKTSGRVLAEYITKKMRSLFNSGEDLPWIYQVTL